MLEKPRLAEEKITNCLKEAFGFEVLELKFLPLGETAWVYDVETKSGRFFLKLKKEDSGLASLAIPHFLAEQGVPHLLCPILTRSGHLFTRVDSLSLALYPFVDADMAMHKGFSAAHCKSLGKTLRRIHHLSLGDALMRQLRKENFVPPWAVQVQALKKQVMTGEPNDSLSADLYSFWESQVEAIDKLVDECLELGQKLQAAPPEFVLCHGDIHTANILLNKDQSDFWIVDWDETVFAPKERDLMFIIQAGSYDEISFFEAYGDTPINHLALAYYRLEWVVQEIGEFGLRIVSNEFTDTTRQNALNNFYALFEPYDVLDHAWDALEKVSEA